ncbi:SUMF1/EgtB/PvdO family nonheme iron enzyme [Sulfidibacter corallicola]|nr:SUMF1/EgtB/PvdO family nonheme iron enzyme [Sulfidibacter corallicola]
MASGACWYDAEHAHSVNWVRLDLAAETVEIRIWSYSSERNGFWKPATELYRNFNGTVTKPIPASWHLSPLESPTGGEETGDGVAGPKPATFAVPIAYKDLMLGQYSDLDAYFSKDKAGKLNLEQVFVSLETGWREPDKNRERRLAGKRGADSQADEAEEPEKPQPQPCENLCRHPTYRHFVLAGKPGSGKSTLLRYLVVSRLHREPDLLPLHLPLRDMQAWLNRKKGHAGSHILDWAADTYGSHGIDRVFLERHTGQGKILWLLDGLDEIFDLSLRLRAAKIIGNWFTSNQGRGDRLILTTRPHALEQARILGNLALPDTRASILPLSEPLQEAFLSHWFLGLYGPTRKKTADEKKQALWHLLEGRPDPDPFRDNPLMLSVLAIIFYNGKTLPERRADLYEQAVDMLLTQRFGPNEKDGSIEKVEQIMRGLGLVARRLLERGRASDVGCHDFQTWFTEGYGRGKHGDQEDVTPLIRELGNHSGLLTQSGDGQPRYAFAHLTFQEYLAARSYAKDREPSKLLRERLGVGTWREVVLLTAGCLFALGADFRGQDFIRGIFACCGDGDTSAVGLSLAMEAMAEAPNHIDLHEDIQKSKALTLAILGNRDSQVPEAARDALGLALGKLGDPRLGVVKPERWVWIPLGRFTMGRNDGDKDEQPEHEVEVDRGFFLGKYPVTNEEYRAFVEADGYGDARWWSRLGRSWLEKEAEGVKTPELWEDRAFNGANQPVVGVSWFEAEAYCNWLGAVLEKNRPGGWAGTPRVYMPSEIQWEYAARGSAGRRHPWGEQEPDEMVANYEGRLGRTSAVGIYPRGATPEGLLDMAGNVWEWCRTRYEGKAYALSTQERESLIIEEIDQSACLRGGSWSYGARGLPAACRLWFWAGGRFDLVGFRCCCVAGPSAEP